MERKEKKRKRELMNTRNELDARLREIETDCRAITADMDAEDTVAGTVHVILCDVRSSGKTISNGEVGLSLHSEVGLNMISDVTVSEVAVR